MCCGAPVDGRATFSTWATASCQAPLWSRLRRWRITCTKRRLPGNSQRRATTSRESQRMSTAVLLMAHGTPSSMDEMPEYVTRVVGIPLAPQFSTLSVKKYVEAAMSAMPPGIGFECVTSYHDHPLLLQAFAERIWEAGMPSDDEAVVFTAHSLPERVIAQGDPYLEQVRATARGVADRAGIATFDLAFQSAGRTWAVSYTHLTLPTIYPV